jgi:aminoglycoside phosphotransferase (APT) family kinase protein
MPAKPGPLAAGARVSWEELPAPVRASIEQACGAPVASARITDLYADAFTGWRTLARQPATSQLDPWTRAHLSQLAALEQTWTAHAAGDTLLHTDLRADNLLLTSDRVMIIDWPHACRGAAFIDPLLLAASIATHGGPPPHHVLARSPAAPHSQP